MGVQKSVIFQPHKTMENRGLQESTAYTILGIIFLIPAFFLALISGDEDLGLIILLGLVGSSMFVVSAIERLKLEKLVKESS